MALCALTAARDVVCMGLALMGQMKEGERRCVCVVYQQVMPADDPVPILLQIMQI